MTAYPELIRYPYQNRISSDNGILGNWLSRAVTKSHIPRSELIGTWLTEWLDGTSQAERNWLYLTTRGFAPIPNYPQYLRLNVSHDCVRPLPRIGLFHPLHHAGLSRPLRFAVRPSVHDPVNPLYSLEVGTIACVQIVGKTGGGSEKDTKSAQCEVL